VSVTERARQFVRERTGTDVSAYKDSALLRRLKARARDLGLADIETYLERVQGSEAEADCEAERLLRSLQVGVSSFFRDPRVFETFEEVVCPGLFGDRDPALGIHGWSAGCSRGQEPYSLAISLRRCAGRFNFPGEISVLGTDVDPAAIATAEQGVYPARALEGLPDEIRAGAFEAARGGLATVRPEIRALVRFRVGDALDFASHPAEMDLISCRNLLIYLRRSVQEDLLVALHRALRPGGYLILGASETMLGRPWRIFEHLSPSQRIYRKPLSG
jgi:chemotaxis methyl-accepting protein methylase